MKRVIIFTLLCCSLAFSEQKQISFYLFSSSTCEKCQYLKTLVLPNLLESYPTVKFQHLPVDDKKGFELFIQYEALYQNRKEHAIKAFVGRRCLSGVKEIETGIKAAVMSMVEENITTPTPSQVRAGFSWNENLDNQLVESLESKFNGLTIFTVIFAGITDGINPCAFVTLIFLISVLANLKKSKREILVVGFTFSLAVFLTYLLIGIGLLSFVKALSVENNIATYLNYGMGAVCFILAFWSLTDVIRLSRSERPKRISLKLPKSIRKRINRTISQHLRSTTLISSTFICGVIISLLESLCTGQVYLPICLKISSDANILAYTYLVLYNLMFILPLLVLFITVYKGVSSKKVTNYFNRHLLLAKLLMTILFFLLAVTLVQ